MWNHSISQRIGFAVVDLETTGLNPAAADRVIEIGVVLLSPDLVVQEQWSTLVDPGRDVGPTHVHHITAREVCEAPRFDRVAGDLAGRLAGRLFVAHNASFDVRFLVAEYGRLGVQIPLSPEGCICTMAAARTYLPGARRNLSSCCRAAGVVQVGAHDALADARATAGLLGYYVARSAGSFWDKVLTTAANQSWPSMAALETPVMRRSDVRERVPPHFLARLVERLPRVESPRLDEYFAMLDVVLMDRYLAQSEADSLVALATELQLDRATALNAHRYYLTSLARVALQDGVVTEAERTDLSAVAALLDLPADAVDDALAQAQTMVGQEIPTAAPFALSRGDHVVLTGSMTKPREFWVERATSAGLVVQPYVTKRTRLVAAADPDSQSGKAVRARLYGIPIITEDAFGYMLDAL